MLFKTRPGTLHSISTTSITLHSKAAIINFGEDYQTIKEGECMSRSTCLNELRCLESFSVEIVSAAEISLSEQKSHHFYKDAK